MLGLLTAYERIRTLHGFQRGNWAGGSTVECRTKSVGMKFLKSYGLSSFSPTTCLSPSLACNSNAVKKPSLCKRKSLVTAS